MSSFLTKKKTTESYWDKIATEPIGTQRNKLKKLTTTYVMNLKKMKSFDYYLSWCAGY